MHLGLGLNLTRPKVSAGGFTPGDLSGLLAWYDTSDTGSVTEVSGFASGWADQTTNGYDLSQSTAANRPAWSGAAPLDFDIDDHLDNASRMGLGANPDLLVSVVLTPSVADLTDVVSFGDNVNGTIICGFTDTGWMWRHKNANIIYGPVSAGTKVVVTWLRSAGDTVGDQRFFLNGVEQSSTSSANPSSVPTDTTETARVGLLGSGAQVNMDIYEVIIAENSSDVDAVDLANWQKSKWSVS